MHIVKLILNTHVPPKLEHSNITSRITYVRFIHTTEDVTCFQLPGWEPKDNRETQKTIKIILIFKGFEVLFVRKVYI